MDSLLQSTFLTGPLKKAGISLKMTEGDKTLCSINEDTPLIPASNMKLIISAAALLHNKQDLFPPLQSFINGSAFEGTVHGDLILDSCGSLIFSARYPADDSFNEKNEILNKQIQAYSNQLKDAGITLFLGDLKLVFNRWNAPHENKHYNAAAAFSFNENTVDTLVKEGKINTVPKSPDVFKFAVNNEIDDQDKVENNLIRFNPKKDSRDYWRIYKYPATKYALAMLKKGLIKNGIKFLNQENTENGEPVKVCETKSLFSVAEYITPLNQHSDNFRAEILALLISRSISGKADYKEVDKSVKETFKSNKLDLKGLKIDDGSGLSRKNRLSGNDITKLLVYMADHKEKKNFLNSLAVAGKSGTLQNRFIGTPWESTFHGKTGTLNNVSSLSGYWIRKDKPLVTFSFIGNGAKNEDFWKALEKFAASLKFMQ